MESKCCGYLKQLYFFLGYCVTFYELKESVPLIILQCGICLNHDRAFTT